MISKNVQLPREVQIGPNIINSIGKLLNDLRFHEDVLIVSGDTTFKVAGKQVLETLEDENFNVDFVKVSDATEENVDKVKEEINNSIVLAIGGGKVIDVAKLASTQAKTYFISIPTILSHDGVLSPLASIKNQTGSISVKAQSPIAVVADTEIISKAPYRFLASGCGDVISNYTAVLDWKLAKKLQNEFYSESAATLTELTANMITSNAEEIKKGHERSVRLVAKTIFSTGVAISIANSSRPASGSEHLFSHALDKICEKPALHGEQCGVGTIMMMNLHGGDWEFIKNSLETVKAPTTAKELKIKEEDIITALTIAHTIRDRYTILGDRGLSREAAEELASSTGVIN